MAEPKDKTKENETVLAQFKRTLDHILISAGAGPEIKVGKTTLKFKKSAPVSALAALIGDENRINGMEQYLRKTLLPGQDEALTELLDAIDIAGLSEILDALGEGFTSFPDKQ
jgi:hypothetical protein